MGYYFGIMMNMTDRQLRFIILIGLFIVPFVPLIVSTSLFFPFIAGKAFIFRLIVEVVFVCYLILALRDETYRPKFNWIFGTLLLFLAVVGLADIFAQNPYKAFWSNFERSEGFVTLLHLGAYFLVLGSVLKTESLWNKLLATSLFSSAIMAVYSFFQLAGKIHINQGGVRVDGTLGNASYLAIYMVFHIFFAALLFSRFRSNWQRGTIALVGLMNLIVLYFTATRGAILGILGGAFFSFLLLLFKSEKGDRIRKLAGAGLLLVLVFVGLFVTFKNSPLVHNSPVLSRFATLSFAEIKNQGRYYVWPMALKGIAERPILGWGQEGFNFVFNKYFDPRMYNQEPWFDRAHNTYLDWAVAGGLLGLFSYLSIFAALLYYIFKAPNENLSKNEKAVMLGLVVAYAFNNLFVFDQISSYILFFTILAYLYNHAPESNLGLWRKIAGKFKSWSDNEKLRPIFEAVLFIFLIVVVYFSVYAPWRQNKNLLAILSLNNQGQIGTIEQYRKPFSGYGVGFSESLEHVSQTAINLSLGGKISPELNQQLFDLLDKSFQKHINKVPGDARYRLFYGIFLSRYGWYGRAIEQLKEAQKLSPQKQQILFDLASNQLLDKKYEEAKENAKLAYDLEPNYEEAKFVYALISLSVGDNVIFNKLMQDLPESKLVFDDRYLSVLLGLGRYDEIIKLAQRRVALSPESMQHRVTLTAAYLQVGRRAEAIQTLQEMINVDPSFKEKGEYYINEIKAGRNP